jgi:hypothetical protein
VRCGQPAAPVDALLRKMGYSCRQSIFPHGTVVFENLPW